MDDLVKIANFPEAVEAIDSLAKAVRDVSDAVTIHGDPVPDESGGYVGSLTEAVIGVTAGLYAIARAIEELSETQRKE